MPDPSQKQNKRQDFGMFNDMDEPKQDFGMFNDLPNKPDAPGFLKSVAGDVAGGVVDVAEQYARAGRALPGGEAAGEGQGGITGSVINWAQEFKKNNPSLDHVDREGLPRWFHEGLRSAVTSIAAGAPGAIAGAGIGAALTGPAAPAGAFIGGVAGYALSGAGVFGAAEYDSAMEEALTAGVPREDAESAAWISAAAEGGFEGVGNLLEGMTMGTASVLTTPGKAAAKQTVKAMLKTSVKGMLKRGAQVSAIEVGSEMMTGGVQTEARRSIGLTEEKFFDGAMEAFGPALVASIIFAGAGEGGAKLNRNRVQKMLEDPSVHPDNRFAAVQEVYKTLNEASPEAAKRWNLAASAAVRNGEAINLDEGLDDSPITAQEIYGDIAPQAQPAPAAPGDVLSNTIASVTPQEAAQETLRAVDAEWLALRGEVAQTQETELQAEAPRGDAFSQQVGGPANDQAALNRQADTDREAELQRKVENLRQTMQVQQTPQMVANLQQAETALAALRGQTQQGTNQVAPSGLDSFVPQQAPLRNPARLLPAPAMVGTESGNVLTSQQYNEMVNQGVEGKGSLGMLDGQLPAEVIGELQQVQTKIANLETTPAKSRNRRQQQNIAKLKQQEAKILQGVKRQQQEMAKRQEVAQQEKPQPLKSHPGFDKILATVEDTDGFIAAYQKKGLSSEEILQRIDKDLDIETRTEVARLKNKRAAESIDDKVDPVGYFATLNDKDTESYKNTLLRSHKLTGVRNIRDLLLGEGDPDLDYIRVEINNLKRTNDPAAKYLEAAYKDYVNKQGPTPAATAEDSTVDAQAAPVDLTATQQQFIAKKVQGLGSAEAVQQQYGSDSPVDQFARQTAKEVFAKPVAAQGSADMAAMVKEAQRWKGAAEGVDLELTDKKARLRHSRITTKGDLDEYLMRKFGIDDSTAREVSNTLTRDDLSSDKTAAIADFAGEPWADAVLNKQTEEDPFADPSAEEVEHTAAAADALDIEQNARASSKLVIDGHEKDATISANSIAHTWYLNEGYPVKEVIQTLRKHSRGEKLAEKQQQILEAWQENNRRLQNSFTGNAYEEDAYDPEWGAMERKLSDAFEAAKEVDEAAAFAIMEGSGADAEILRRLIALTENQNGQSSAEGISQEVERQADGLRTEEEAGIPAQKVGDDGKLFATPPTFGKKSKPEGANVSVLAMEDEQAIAADDAKQTGMFNGEVASKSPASPETVAPETAKTEAAKIEDFGEVLEGARKHYAEAYRDKMTEAQELSMASEPLSKSWPEPSYQKLLEGGMDPWTVAFVHSMRDEMATKPKSRWHLGQWSEQATELRRYANEMLSGGLNKETIQKVLGQDSVRRLKESLYGRTELYLAAGHDRSLKGIRLVVGSYGVYAGVHYSPAKTVWSVEQKAKKTAFSNWPSTLADGDTKEEAIAKFKTKLENGGLEPKAKGQTKFIIYARHGSKEWIVGKKNGSNYIDLEKFDTSQDARVYLAESRDKLEAKLAKIKDIPNERKESNAPRVGVDHRNGADVTPEMFTDSFGFRGVQFGNYVEGSKRQKDLNEAYDALMDLAGVLDLPTKALSLNGELGLAFGARGHGGKLAPKAHYEPVKVVINLTKKEGAGSLAHEWFHAVDNYFSRLRNDKNSYMTEKEGGEGVRQAMTEAFAEIKKALNRTNLRLRSQKLDDTRTKAYWATGVEMSARSFESYIIAKLQDQGASNDYLANIVTQEYWDAAASLGLEKEDSFPYVQAAELPDIRAAFDNFFNVVETKETEQGVALYSRKDNLQRQEFYHGTGQTFDTFDIPSWFTSKPEIASIYSNTGQGPQRVVPVRLGIDNPIELSFDEIKDLSKGQIRAYRQAGYDGAVAVMENETVAVPFAPEQIRSTFNQEPFGTVANYQRTQGSGLPIADLQAGLKESLNKLPGALGKVTLHQTEADLPQDLQDAIEREKMNGAFDGVYWQGKVHLVADNLESLESAQKALLHEVRHLGLEHLLGGNKKPILAQTAAVFNKEVAAHLKQHKNKNTPQNRLMAAEEVLVDMVRQNSAHKFVDSVIAKVREWVRRVFPNLNLSKSELRNLIANVDSYLQNGDGSRFTGDLTTTTAPAYMVAAWHGSPHDHDKFDSSKIGTGEGAQAYGHGLYFAGRKEVAEWYREALAKGKVRYYDGDQLSNHLPDLDQEQLAAYYVADYGDNAVEMLKFDKEHLHFEEGIDALILDAAIAIAPKIDRNEVKVEKPGKLYEVELAPNEDEFLDWDKPLSEQSAKVREALEKVPTDVMRQVDGRGGDGSSIYRVTVNNISNRHILKHLNELVKEGKIGLRGQADQKASEYLHSLGIRGIRYLDGGSRSQGEGNSNYVIFSDEDVSIKAKYSRKTESMAVTSELFDTPEQHTITSAINGALGRLKGVDVKTFADDARTKLVDRMHPIEQLGEKAYMLHRLLGNTHATLSTYLQHGKLSWDQDTLTVKEKDQGFLPWLKTLGDDGRNVFYWVAAKRAEVLEKEGRENWLTKEKRTALYDEIFAGLSPAQRTQKEAEFAEHNKKFQEFNDNIIQVSKEAGLVSQEQVDSWMRDFYLPFYRIMEDEQTHDEFISSPQKSKKHISAQIKRLEGGEEKIGDPIENVLRNWAHMVQEGQRNVARSSAAEVASNNGLAQRVPGNESFKSPGARRENSVISFQENGKPVYLQVSDIDLFEALAETNAKAFDSVMLKVLGSAKRVLTMGATIGPAFRIANLLRDTLHTAVVSKSFAPFVDTAKGLVQVWKESPDYIALMASGGGFGQGWIESGDPKAMARSIEKIVKREGEGARGRILDTPRKLWEFWERTGHASEMAARVQLYTNLKMEGEGNLKASYEARDLLDFYRTGSSNAVRVLSMVTPFLNARIQGLDRMYRGAKADPKAFVTKGALISAASLMLWALFHDDDRYKDMEDWEKWQYHHFWIGDQHFRIPKAFEVGALFSTLPESAAAAMTGDEEGEFFLRFLSHTLTETFSVGAPAAFAPAREVYANKSAFTGRPLEGMSLERLPAGERSKPWTPELLKDIGKGLNISPIKMEHMIQGHFAVLGTSILTAADAAYRWGKGSPAQPAGNLNDLPGLGRFVRSDAGRSKYATRYYELAREINELSATASHYKQLGDYQKARELAQAKPMQYKRFVNLTSQRLAALRKQERLVYSSSSMSSASKRKRLDALSERSKAIFRQAYERIK